MIVVESVLPDLVLQSEFGARATVALCMDLMMLSYASTSAKERTLHELRQIAKAAGFTSVSVVAPIDFLSVLEFNTT